jgi:hypothetical protein
MQILLWDRAGFTRIDTEELQFFAILFNLMDILNSISMV